MPGTDKTSESRGTGTSSRRRSGTKASAGSGLRFLVYVLRRYFADAGTQRAAALTYTSLLAVVPLLAVSFAIFAAFPAFDEVKATAQNFVFRSEEHTSELQSLMRISYAVFCLKKKN